MKTIKQLEKEIEEREGITEEEHNLILENVKMFDKKIEHPLELGEIQLERIVSFMRRAKLQTLKDVLKLLDEFFGSDRMWSTKIARFKQKIQGK